MCSILKSTHFASASSARFSGASEYWYSFQAEANKLADQANARYETAVAGKKLLDDGGPPMEQKLVAKAAARRCVQSAVVATSQIDDVIGQYTELLKELNVCATNTAMTAVERAEFAALRTSYVDALSSFQHARAALSKCPPPGILSISPQEDDAISILWAQGKAQTALEHAKQVSDEAVSAMPVATPVATPVAKPGEDEREV